VTQDERAFGHKASGVTVFKIMHIRATNTHSLDFYENISGVDLGDSPTFRANIPLAV
jgi:hypothetical protein